MTPRVGVVGTGWWATNAHLPALRSYDGADLVAVCDVRQDRAETVARRFDIPHVFSSVGELLDVVDAVVVATPHSTHHEIARAALDAGCHALVEKPLALTSAEAWDLVDAAEAAGVTLSVGYTAQHTSAARFVRDRLQGGAIGELVEVSAEFSSSTSTFFGASGSSANSDEPGVPHPQTYGAIATGGGQAHTQLTHLVGMLLWALERDAEEAFCFMDRRGLDVDVVDAVTFKLAGGGLGVAASTGTAVDIPARHVVRYHGSTGMLEQDMLEARATLYQAGESPVSHDRSDGEETYPVGAPARALADLAAGRGENPAPGRWGASAVALVEAAHRSALSGRPEVVVGSAR